MAVSIRRRSLRGRAQRWANQSSSGTGLSRPAGKAKPADRSREGFPEVGTGAAPLVATPNSCVHLRAPAGATGVKVDVGLSL